MNPIQKILSEKLMTGVSLAVRDVQVTELKIRIHFDKDHPCFRSCYLSWFSGDECEWFVTHYSDDPKLDRTQIDFESYEEAMNYIMEISQE